VVSTQSTTRYNREIFFFFFFFNKIISYWLYANYLCSTETRGRALVQIRSAWLKLSMTKRFISRARLDDGFYPNFYDSSSRSSPEEKS
jgi:hypothetical protein